MKLELETTDDTPRPEPSAERPRPVVAVTSWEALFRELLRDVGELTGKRNVTLP